MRPHTHRRIRTNERSDVLKAAETYVDQGWCVVPDREADVTEFLRRLADHFENQAMARLFHGGDGGCRSDEILF